MFQTLAEADGDEVDHAKIGGVPTIHIRNLKAFLKNEKSLKVMTVKENGIHNKIPTRNSGPESDYQ